MIHLIGGGLAGSILAWHLYWSDDQWKWSDEHYSRRPSDIAAGILNPITGRKYALSWKFPELLEEAKTFYRKVEREIGEQVFRELPLYRGIRDDRIYQEWDIRSADHPQYMGQVKTASELCPELHTTSAYFGEVYHAHQLWISKFCTATWDFMSVRSRDSCTSAPQMMDQESVASSTAIAHSGKVIIAQGPSRSLEDLFPLEALHRTKGDVFLIRSGRPDHSRIIKDRFFLCPLWVDDLYWVGSNYEHRADSDEPTERMAVQLRDFCDEILEGDYQLIRHIAAYRPTVVDRRPIIGPHSQHDHIYLCNGLGTKGASLGPLAARLLMDFIRHENSIPEHVSIARFS